MAIKFSNTRVKLIFSEVKLKVNTPRQNTKAKIRLKVNLEFSESNK